MSMLELRQHLSRTEQSRIPILLCERGNGTLIEDIGTDHWFCRVVGSDSDMTTKVMRNENDVPGWRGLSDVGVLAAFTCLNAAIHEDCVGGELVMFSFDIKEGDVVFHTIVKEESLFSSQKELRELET